MRFSARIRRVGDYYYVVCYAQSDPVHSLYVATRDEAKAVRCAWESN